MPVRLESSLNRVAMVLLLIGEPALYPLVTVSRNGELSVLTDTYSIIISIMYFGSRIEPDAWFLTRALFSLFSLGIIFRIPWSISCRSSMWIPQTSPERIPASYSRDTMILSRRVLQASKRALYCSRVMYLILRLPVLRRNNGKLRTLALVNSAIKLRWRETLVVKMAGILQMPSRDRNR